MAEQKIGFEAFFDRVAELLDIDSQQELAEFLGVNRSAVTQAKKRDSVPQRWILKLSRTLGLDPDWLERGEGTARVAWSAARSTAHTTVHAAAESARESRVAEGFGRVAGSIAGAARGMAAYKDARTGAAGAAGAAGAGVGGRPDMSGEFAEQFAAIPKVRARLCAGAGSFEVGAEVEGYYAFDRSWLQRKGGAGNMVLMDVMGNSMEPEIREGDTVLIDQGRRDVIAGSIYAVGVEDTVMVKRVERRPGALALLSDNRDYSPIVLSGDELNTVRLVGKVVWIGREYL